MMQSKLYILLVVLSVFVIHSISVDQYSRQDDTSLDSKNKVDHLEKDEDEDRNRYQDKDEDRNRYQDKDDENYDDHTALSSFANTRYSPMNQQKTNYRGRSRYQSPSPPAPAPSSSYDDSNDWSRFGYDSFPASIPSASYNNGPVCHSLIDQQYPVFSDTCGAVPQARYTLPNAFGHRERWQVSQVLSVLMASSTDPTCIRSLRLLLCPVLFPPCPTRHQPPPVLPCQSYCRAVKSRCAIPALDLLPCEILPYSSDLCPTGQSYGSFMPPGAFPSGPQPPMNGPPPPTGYPMPRPFPSLQSLLSPQGFQSASPLNLYNGGQYGSDNLASMYADFPSRSYGSDNLASMYADFPSRSYGSDNLASMYADFPSRSYGNDYRQGSRYAAPLTRSATETRPTNEVKTATAPRSSVVKA